MASIRIRVGAVLDPGATAVFAPLVAAAQRARKQIAQSGKEAAAEYVGGYRSAPAHAKKSFDDTARAAEAADQKIVASGKRASQERVASAEQESRAVQRLLDKQVATSKRIISSAGRTFGGIVRSGVGLAGEVVRGAGVDLSVGSLVGRNVATQKTATDITASAYVEGAAGSVGRRQDPKAVIAAAKAAADAAAISEETALAGLQKFVGKSTDLETGMKLLREMAIQSKATGSNLEDVMDAAGDISVKLADTPDKAKILAGVMATVAKQGQLGASELRAMAPFIGRIVSSSNMFASGTEKAVQELGAAFQITKKMQGQTPGSAATSVSRFVDTLTSKTGLKNLHAAGLKDTDIFADKGKTKLKDISEIIPLLLDKAGGDLTKLAKTMPNVKAGAVLKAFGQIYSDAEKAGGKGAGAKAVRETFSAYGGAMSQKQIQESLAQAMGTTESKAQLFQNRLQAIADQNLPSLITSLEKLAPAAAKAAEAFAAVVGWAAENPGKAITAAIVASIAKAGLAAAIEGGVTTLLKAVGGAGGGGGGLGALGGRLGAAGAGVALGTAGGMYVRGELQEGAGMSTDIAEKASDAIGKAIAEYKSTGTISPETRKALSAQEAENKKQMAIAQDESVSMWKALNPFSDVTIAAVGQKEGAQMNTGNFANQNLTIEALLGAPAKHHTEAAAATKEAATALKDAATALKDAARPQSGATTGPTPVR